MKHATTLLLAAALMGGSAMAASATDLHVILCGDARPADKVVTDKFQADNPDIKVNVEIVPWGTCQDKAMTLAAAGDPVGLAYIGSRTLLKLSKEGLIVPAEISDDMVAKYQPGVLKTVTSGGKYWGYPHAFSTKALYINCDLVKAAGMECKAPETWADMIAMAKAIKEKDGVAGIGIAGKDFDNTMLCSSTSSIPTAARCLIPTPAKRCWTASRPAKPCNFTKTCCPTWKKARPPGNVTR